MAESGKPDNHKSDSDLISTPRSERGGRRRSDKHAEGIGHKGDNSDVFNVETAFQDMRGAPPTHWSVTWADLMMTMFILFMTLYVYQMANRSFLEEDQEATDMSQQDSAFYIPGQAYDQGDGGRPKGMERAEDEQASVKVEGKMPRELEREELKAQQQEGAGFEAEITTTVKGSPEYREPGDETTPSVDQKVPREAPIPEDKPEILTKLFDLSQYTLAQEKLQRFATVDVVQNKAVRIILTGDLLFGSGQAILTGQAEDALSRLSPVLRRIPYMINVVGHTDSTPMFSAKFPSNWELSVARASSVARFLMEEMELPGRQFVVSGYAFYRPVRPNNSVVNRARNRRVEIIISRELPEAMAATEINIK